jgi:hypothetical protein
MHDSEGLEEENQSNSMHSGKVEHSPLKEILILMLTFSKITMGADKEDTEMLQDFL